MIDIVVSCPSLSPQEKREPSIKEFRTACTDNARIDGQRDEVFSKMAWVILYPFLAVFRAPTLVKLQLYVNIGKERLEAGTTARDKECIIGARDPSTVLQTEDGIWEQGATRALLPAKYKVAGNGLNLTRLSTSDLEIAKAVQKAAENRGLGAEEKFESYSTVLSQRIASETTADNSRAHLRSSSRAAIPTKSRSGVFAIDVVKWRAAEEREGAR
ncbi:hypothetical protein C8J56DRAFT_901771 [Mycena floridula]|nr:hypothetical protein C8J56DRAFT_901771 [Mycena floridula]